METKTDVVSTGPFQKYVDTIKENDLDKALAKNTKAFLKLLKNIPRKKIDFAYAEGKWTVKQLLQHIIDCERVFCYRALSFSRNDNTALPGFDENAWATNAPVKDRKWKDLVEEFKDLRKSTLHMFGSFTKEQLARTGSANNLVLNVKALGFICAGHVQHHINILQEKYLGKAK